MRDTTRQTNFDIPYDFWHCLREAHSSYAFPVNGRPPSYDNGMEPYGKDLSVCRELARYQKFWVVNLRSH